MLVALTRPTSVPWDRYLVYDLPTTGDARHVLHHEQNALARQFLLQAKASIYAKKEALVQLQLEAGRGSFGRVTTI